MRHRCPEKVNPAHLIAGDSNNTASMQDTLLEFRAKYAQYSTDTASTLDTLLESVAKYAHYSTDTASTLDTLLEFVAKYDNHSTNTASMLDTLLESVASTQTKRAAPCGTALYLVTPSGFEPLIAP